MKTFQDCFIEFYYDAQYDSSSCVDSIDIINYDFNVIFDGDEYLIIRELFRTDADRCAIAHLISVRSAKIFSDNISIKRCISIGIAKKEFMCFFNRFYKSVRSECESICRYLNDDTVESRVKTIEMQHSIVSIATERGMLFNALLGEIVGEC